MPTASPDGPAAPPDPVHVYADLLSLASRSDLDALAAREGGYRLDTVDIVLLGEGVVEPRRQPPPRCPRPSPPSRSSPAPA